MKFLRFLSLAVLGASTVFADDKPSFTISAHYADFDPAFLADATQDSTGKTQNLSTPRVTTKAGQRAIIEIIKEFIVLSSTNEPHRMNCGVTLEVEPDFKDGRVLLSGKSTVRRHDTPTEKQPLKALSFTTRETFFDGEVSDDKPLTIQTGDGIKDTSRVILTVTRVEPCATLHASHDGLPKYRVYAIEPAPEEAKKPIYKNLGFIAAKTADGGAKITGDSPPQSDLAIAGVFQPAEESNSMLLLVKDSLRELPPTEQPLTISTVLGQDRQTLDWKIQSQVKSARPASTELSTWWGSDIYLTMADPTHSGGRRGLLIRQEE